LNKKYIFNPDYYFQDSNKRILYTIDRKIVLQFNLNFSQVNFDIYIIYYIMSVCQLMTLELISSSYMESVVEYICELINLRVKFMYNKRIHRIRKFINGDKVYDVTLVLTSEEFDVLYNSELDRVMLQVRLANERKFKLN
jgi:hypothetical protein